ELRLRPGPELSNRGLERLNRIAIERAGVKIEIIEIADQAVVKQAGLMIEVVEQAGVKIEIVKQYRLIEVVRQDG
ncbi:16700_t:CDS:2, partial [Racocetra fulgida]